MAYLHSDREQFRDAIDLAYEQTGVMVQAIEKDYYVTMLLRLLAQRIPTSRKSRSVTDEFQRCKSKLNNPRRKNPLRALCRERYEQQRSRQKISCTGRGSQRVWCRPLSKMSLCMMEGASWYGSNMSRASRML